MSIEHLMREHDPDAIKAWNNNNNKWNTMRTENEGYLHLYDGFHSR